MARQEGPTPASRSRTTSTLPFRDGASVCSMGCCTARHHVSHGRHQDQPHRLRHAAGQARPAACMLAAPPPQGRSQAAGTTQAVPHCFDDSPNRACLAEAPKHAGAACRYLRLHVVLVVRQQDVDVRVRPRARAPAAAQGPFSRAAAGATARSVLRRSQLICSTGRHRPGEQAQMQDGRAAAAPAGRTASAVLQQHRLAAAAHGPI